MPFFHRFARAAGVALCLIGISLGARAQAPAAAGDAAGPVIVTLETSMGRIVLELDATRAPRSVANFVQYVKSGFYDGTIFHRVIPGFMVQGGGYAAGPQHKTPLAPIAIESNNGLHNVRGSIAMARTSDPNSATSQFFVNVVDNANLDYPGMDGNGYTVFGKVVEGLDTVDKIVMVPTMARGPEFQNLPKQDVVLQKAHLGK